MGSMRSYSSYCGEWGGEKEWLVRKSFEIIATRISWYMWQYRCHGTSSSDVSYLHSVRIQSLSLHANLDVRKIGCAKKCCTICYECFAFQYSFSFCFNIFKVFG